MKNWFLSSFSALKLGLPMVQSLVQTFVLVNFSPSYQYTGKFGILNSALILSRIHEDMGILVINARIKIHN